jgi:hypothetical protein
LAGAAAQADLFVEDGGEAHQHGDAGEEFGAAAVPPSAGSRLAWLGQRAPAAESASLRVGSGEAVTHIPYHLRFDPGILCRG